MRILVLFLCALATAASAQSSVAVQRDQMKKLDWMVGEWEGEGWIQMGPEQKRAFTQTETVQRKLNGLVLVIEGSGKSKERIEGQERFHFQALTSVSYDEQAMVYRWRAHTSDGRQSDTVLKVAEKGFEWRIDIPQRGTMRYAAKLNAKGEWFEIGERSEDGQTWHQFFEMTLQRVR